MVSGVVVCCELRALTDSHSLTKESLGGGAGSVRLCNESAPIPHVALVMERGTVLRDEHGRKPGNAIIAKRYYCRPARDANESVLRIPLVGRFRRRGTADRRQLIHRVIRVARPNPVGEIREPVPR